MLGTLHAIHVRHGSGSLQATQVPGQHGGALSGPEIRALRQSRQIERPELLELLFSLRLQFVLLAQMEDPLYDVDFSTS